MSVICVLIASVLLYAAAGKCLGEFGKLRNLASVSRASVVTAAVEVVVAFSLCLRSSARLAAASAMLMFVCFAAVLTMRSRRYRYADCGCFGAFDSPGVDLRLRVALDVAFATLAGAVAIEGAGVSAPTSFVVAICAASIAANVTLLKKLWRNVDRPAQHVVVDLEFTNGERLPVNLGQNKGSYQAVLFLHPDCPPCQRLLESAPMWLSALERAGGVVVMKAPLVVCQDFQRRFDLPVVASDDRHVLGAALGVTGTPCVALNRTGGEVVRINGAASVANWLKVYDRVGV